MEYSGFNNKRVSRQRENFRAITGPRRDFDLILLILNMIIRKNFTGPTHFYQQMSEDR